MPKQVEKLEGRERLEEQEEQEEQPEPESVAAPDGRMTAIAGFVPRTVGM